MKIVVLYTRLTGYWMACMRFDHQKKGNQYLLIRKDPNPEAPFSFNSEAGINILDGDQLSAEDIKKTAKDFKPDVLYVAGWAEKRYLKTALYFNKKGVPVITGMDNQWLGNFKQRMAGLMSPLLVRKYFSHIWIPGDPQYIFAHHLGFSSNNILKGLYCADEVIFNSVTQRKFERQITFVGRLVEHKGLQVLFEVIRELIQNDQLLLKVHIIGNGPLAENIPNHKFIKNTSFVDPEELPALLENSGFFILPSLYEAWGVVVHEAVLAGLPVITTKQTGAASAFVIPGHNGFIYDAPNAAELKKILLEIGNLSDEDYLQMSNNSKEMASRISLNTWSATLNSVVK
ncbi:glycosyltransferase [Zunongwangia sp. F260]|uniref:Glycosyltransferase n=1 Tax=Autumnicola lenta TaxID=3075593 RepID=A0ABU3CMJ9_9FLAO|nr:glycosyltransferase [Zunongwangia sp. F260]MDT0647443.1 glycosyltransferase [Zunongwangia sp. F260]